MKTVLVFAERMLPSTQTFIPLQVGALTRYRVQYAGLITAERNFMLPQSPLLLTNNRSLKSRFRREVYRWTGVAPNFHERIRSTAPDLIHAHFAEGASAALFLSRQLGIPLIFHLRGGAELFTDAQLVRHMYQMPYLAFRRELWQRVSLVLCVSEFIRDKAIKAGFPETKIRVHYTGVNWKLFSPAGEVSEKDPNLVLYVGRLVRYKGCDYLLRAMSLVQKAHPMAHLVVIGDGDFRPALERLSSDLGIRCTFLGEQSQEEIRKWLDRGRVFCSPSITANDGMSEAFGNVFSEAQAMGVPVVSFRHGGIPEAMLDGVTGLLASERDVDQLAACLMRYLQDDDFWSRSRLEGMRFVRRTFDIDSQTAKLEDIYDEVIRDFRSEEGSRLSNDLRV